MLRSLASTPTTSVKMNVVMAKTRPLTRSDSVPRTSPTAPVPRIATGRVASGLRPWWMLRRVVA